MKQLLLFLLTGLPISCFAAEPTTEQNPSNTTITVNEPRSLCWHLVRAMRNYNIDWDKIEEQEHEELKASMLAMDEFKDCMERHAQIEHLLKDPDVTGQLHKALAYINRIIKEDKANSILEATWGPTPTGQSEIVADVMSNPNECVPTNNSFLDHL